MQYPKHKKFTQEQMPNLYLLGFMGTGKSVLGKRLATRLGFRFIDADYAIERQQGRSIKEIFEQEGEPYFRNLERQFLESGHPTTNCVVSCGGGMTCRDDMPELVKTKGVCVVLFSTPEEILSRIQHNKKRPLLNVDDKLGEIKRLMELRRPFYMRSGIAIKTAPSILDTLEHIIRIYSYNSRFYKK